MPLSQVFFFFFYADVDDERYAEIFGGAFITRNIVFLLSGRRNRRDKTQRESEENMSRTKQKYLFFILPHLPCFWHYLRRDHLN